MDYLAQPKHWKMDMRFGTWNVRSLYRSGSLKTVARELGKHKLDLVGVQEVRWDRGGTERAEDYTFFYGVENVDHQLETCFLCIRESYQQL
jgi:exonuclease III